MKAKVEHRPRQTAFPFAIDAQAVGSSDRSSTPTKKVITQRKVSVPKLVPGRATAWRVCVEASVYSGVTGVCEAYHADVTYYVNRAAAILLESVDHLVIKNIETGFLPKPSPNRDGRRIHVDRKIFIRIIEQARSEPGCPSLYILERIVSGVASECLNRGIVDTVKQLIFEDRAKPC